jgi:hypothetical protein
VRIKTFGVKRYPMGDRVIVLSASEVDQEGTTVLSARCKTKRELETEINELIANLEQIKRTYCSGSPNPFLQTKNVKQILEGDFDPLYHKGETLTFECETLTGCSLAGHRFKEGDTISVLLCTDWDGIEYETRPMWPWALLDDRASSFASFSARTLYRVAERIVDEQTDIEVWSRDNVIQGVVP